MLRGIGLPEVLVIALVVGALFVGRRTGTGAPTAWDRAAAPLLGFAALGLVAATRMAPLELVVILAAGGLVAVVSRLTEWIASTRGALAVGGAVIALGLVGWFALAAWSS